MYCVDLGESFQMITTLLIKSYSKLAKIGFDTAENEPLEVFWHLF